MGESRRPLTVRETTGVVEGERLGHRVSERCERGCGEHRRALELPPRGAADRPIRRETGVAHVRPHPHPDRADAQEMLAVRELSRSAGVLEAGEPTEISPADPDAPLFEPRPGLSLCAPASPLHLTTWFRTP